MICFEELECLIKRLGILFENTDNPEEKLATEMCIGNLKELKAQLEKFSKTEQFKELSKKYENN